MHWPDKRSSLDPMQHAFTILDVLEGNYRDAQDAIDGLELAGFDPEYCERIRLLLWPRGEC